MLALHPRQVHPVHLRFLSRARALAGQRHVCVGGVAAAPAADPAAAGQEPECRAFLHRIPCCGVLPAAWRRPRRLCHRLDHGRALELRRQPHRRRQCAGEEFDAGDRTAAGAARKAGRAARHRPLLSALAAGLAPRPDTGKWPAALGRFRDHRRGGVRADILLWPKPAAVSDLCRDLRRHRPRDRGHGARPRRAADRRHQALGRASHNAGHLGDRHRRFNADRDRAGARAAFDHPVDPHLRDRLHRVLARRAADHRAVLCDLYAAACSCPAISPWMV